MLTRPRLSPEIWPRAILRSAGFEVGDHPADWRVRSSTDRRIDRRPIGGCPRVSGALLGRAENHPALRVELETHHEHLVIAHRPPIGETLDQLEAPRAQHAALELH